VPLWDDAVVRRRAARLRLGPGLRRRPVGGARLGQGPGASLEFHDHRAYVAGDDLRHLDWGVLARSDQLMLRRYRVEVTPCLELLVDASHSLGARPAKAATALAVTALLLHLARSEGVQPRLWWCGSGVRRLDRQPFEALRTAMWGGESGWEQPVAGLAPGAERVLIGDGLCRSAPGSVVQRLGQGAGRVSLVQVLDEPERHPAPGGALRLEDVEGGVSDMVLDAAAVAAYRSRLDRHLLAWRHALDGRGSGVIDCRAEAGLEGAIAALLAARLVEARCP
jgi:uncharacterized protein (DUF58 family)